MGACATKPQKQKHVPAQAAAQPAVTGSESKKYPPESPRSPRLDTLRVASSTQKKLDAQFALNKQARQSISGNHTEDMLAPAQLIARLKDSLGPLSIMQNAEDRQSGRMSYNINKNNQILDYEQSKNGCESEIQQYGEVIIDQEDQPLDFAAQFAPELLGAAGISVQNEIEYDLHLVYGLGEQQENCFMSGQKVDTVNSDIGNKVIQKLGVYREDDVEEEEEDGDNDYEFEKQGGKVKMGKNYMPTKGTMTAKLTQSSLDNQSTQFTTGVLNDQISKKDDNLTSETATATHKLPRPKKSVIVSTHESGIVLKVLQPTEESALEVFDNSIINEVPNSVEETECEENLTDENAESVVQKNQHFSQIGEGILTNMVSNMERRNPPFKALHSSNPLSHLSQIRIVSQ